MKRDLEAMRLRLEAEPRCRVCKIGRELDVHHIVPRRVTQCDEATNLIVLCRICHQAVHDHHLDLLPHLTSYEQAKAVLLTGSIEQARMLLAPSAYRVVA